MQGQPCPFTIALLFLSVLTDFAGFRMRHGANPAPSPMISQEGAFGQHGLNIICRVVFVVLLYFAHVCMPCVVFCVCGRHVKNITQFLGTIRSAQKDRLFLHTPAAVTTWSLAKNKTFS